MQQFVGLGGDDDDERAAFEKRRLFESHFHGFYRTGLAGLPWRFAQRNVNAADAGRANVIEIDEPAAVDAGSTSSRLNDALEDIKSNKTEELFSCGAWGGIAFNRWLRVDRVFKSIITQGYFGLQVLGAGVEYQDPHAAEPFVFSQREQRKLVEVAVCSKQAGLGSHRAQAATLSAPEIPEAADNYEQSCNEQTLRQARWRAFREGTILGARRIIFGPRDVEYAGCGKQNRTSAQSQRDAAGSGLTKANGAFRGRVVYRKSGWKKFCEAYEDSADQIAADELLNSLCRDAKDVNGAWSRPPERRRLEEQRQSDGFLRWLSPHDTRAHVVAYTHNAAVLSSCTSIERRRVLMKNHAFFMARCKDASVAVERFNRHPQVESQIFKTGAARNTEIMKTLGQQIKSCLGHRERCAVATEKARICIRSQQLVIHRCCDRSNNKL